MDYNDSQNAMNTNPHAPNAATALDVEIKTSVRQLLDVQEYHVAKGDIIKKGFDIKSAVDQWVTYQHGLSQLPSLPSYTGEILILFICIQLIPIENNAMLGSVKFMVDFQWIHFNAKKALYNIL